MKKIILLLFIVTLVEYVVASPAYPHKIPVNIDGVNIYIRLFGDEQNKRAETLDGYTIIQDNQNKWWYATLNEEGCLIKSSYALKVGRDNSIGFQNFISKTPLHLESKTNRVQKPDIIRRIGKAIGERRVLVILMEYQDLKFTKTSEDFEALFNEKNYHEDGAQGSVKDYYYSASYGQLELTSDIYGPYTASQNASYYGSNDISGSDMNPYDLFIEAMENVSNDTDLKIYDGDGDGYIDNVHIIYAGYGEEAGGPATSIWAHESTFSRPYEMSGVKIDKYSCAPELRDNRGYGISRIGPHCHEIGHALGAMDYYDTDYDTNGAYLGTGRWDVMAHGSWNNDGVTPADFNPYVKAVDYGWIELQVLPEGQVVIPASNTNKNGYYMLSSSDDGDYYLLENRSEENWGKHLPGTGLLIYHLHSDIAYARNKINTTSPQRCYIVCASSKSQKPSNNASSYGDINSAGCPYPGTSSNRSFGQTTVPMAFYWDGSKCQIELDDIVQRQNGDIELLNLSEGANYKPAQDVNLIFEGFEGDPLFSLLEVGNGKWTYVKDPNNTSSFLNKPVAYAGNMSLQLSATTSYFESKQSVIEFECDKKDPDGSVTLTGYYTSYGLTRKSSNCLMLGYMSAQGEWIWHEVRSSSNLIWNSFTIEIPNTAIMKFRIEGIANPGTILAIDDISVNQRIRTSVKKVKQNELVLKREADVFSMYGFKLSGLRKGLNIIRKVDGTTKKIIIN